jgi:hypothetical protein
VHHFTPKTSVCIIVLQMASASAAKSESAPLPRERPAVPGDQFSASKIEPERSPCQLQLSEIAEFKSMPPITGPGECTATDVVDVNAVLLPDNHRVVFSPVVTLQCSMAEVVAHWIRDDVAPTLDALGMSLRGVETLESFGCRTFNGISKLLSRSDAVPSMESVAPNSANTGMPTHWMCARLKWPTERPSS